MRSEERAGGRCEGLTQWGSPLTELPSPLGEEERESPFSVVSELEPFWLWWSADNVALEDVAEVDEGLAFSLKSVMMTVRSPTVTSRCWALLRSMFFNLGLVGKTQVYLTGNVSLVFPFFCTATQLQHLSFLLFIHATPYILIPTDPPTWCQFVYLILL